MSRPQRALCRPRRERRKKVRMQPSCPLWRHARLLRSCVVTAAKGPPWLWRNRAAPGLKAPAPARPPHTVYGPVSM
jgi:hypothetical protein